MTKIDQVVIHDFRAYKNTQTFSFDHADGVANLVVIYAPNGYGKTSFFDAVEWTFSDRIGRFEHLQGEINRREFAEGHQILLTNRKSFEEGRSGKVDIKLSDGRTLSRSVSPRRITGRTDWFYDYRDGFYDSDTVIEENIKTLNRTNILTQDQIDSFLRYKSPEAKFQALAEFWPQGDTAVRTYKNLDGYQRVLRNAKNDHLKRKNEVEEEIGKLLNTEQNVVKVNEAITALKTISILDFDIENVAHPVSEALYHSLKEAALSFIKKCDRIRETLEKDKGVLQELLGNFETFRITNSRVESLRGILKEYEQLAMLIASRNAAIIERRRVAQLLNEDTALLKSLQELEKNKSRYLENISANQSIQREIKILIIENAHDIEMTGTFDASFKNLERTLENWQITFTEITSKLNKFTETSNRYQLLNQQANEQNVTLKLELDLRLKTQKQLDELQQAKDDLTFIKLKVPNLDTNDLQIQKPDFKLLHETFQGIANKEQQLEKQLQSVKQAAQQIGSLNENLDRILLWSDNFITETGTSQCPVCTNSFENMDELLAKIREQKTTVLNLDREQREIERLENELIQTRQQKNEALNSLNYFLAQEIAAYDMTASQLRDQLTDIGRRIAEKEGVVNFLQKQMADIVAELTSGTQPSIDLTKNTFKEVELNLVEEKAELEQKIARITNLIGRKRSQLEVVLSRIAVNKNRQSTLENELKLNESDQIYKETLRLIQTLAIPFAEKLDDLTKHITAAIIAVADDQTIIDKQDELLKELQPQIQTATLKTTENELPGKTATTRLEIQDLNDNIADYSRKYGRLFNTEETITLIQITDKQSQNDKTLESLSKERVALDTLLVQIDLINENVFKAKLEEELSHLNILLPRIETAETRLLESQQAAVQYIDGEINRYFNKDVINQIYSRIEPHPDLNAIEFIPEITGKSLILDVKASGTEDKLNPVLYLSAGQLNVLSLSIFLAKVFETGNEEISTIFMDDPVQNLSDINVLSFIDLIRSMVVTHDKQIVISTHDEQFFKLVQNKMPASGFSSKFIEFENFGQIK